MPSSYERKLPPRLEYHLRIARQTRVADGVGVERNVRPRSEFLRRTNHNIYRKQFMPVQFVLRLLQSRTRRDPAREVARAKRDLRHRTHLSCRRSLEDDHRKHIQR